MIVAKAAWLEWAEHGGTSGHVLTAREKRVGYLDVTVGGDNPLRPLALIQKEDPMLSRNLLSLWFVVGLAFLAGAPISVAAQDATPTAAMASNDLPVVATGLTNPRGMTWGADGTLFVALAGSGGDTPGVPEFPPPLGPFMGGPTASVVRIEASCPVAVADGLPSVVTRPAG